MEITPSLEQDASRYEIERRTGLLTAESWHLYVANNVNHDSSEQNHAVLFLDVNNFKRINDTKGVGHAVGDQVIEDIAALLKETVAYFGTAGHTGGDESSETPDEVPDIVRHMEIVTGHTGEDESPETPDMVKHMEIIAGHTGGDEFALYCKTDEYGASVIKQYLKDRFDQYLHEERDQEDERVYLTKLKVGLAVGIGIAKPGMTSKELLGLADEAMYTDKNSIKLNLLQRKLVESSHFLFRSLGIEFSDGEKYIKNKTERKKRS